MCAVVGECKYVISHDCRFITNDRKRNDELFYVIILHTACELRKEVTTVSTRQLKEIGMKLFVIGISGISGGGKTTLATGLQKYLTDEQNADTFDGLRINEVVLIHQDEYFYPRDSPHHTWIPEINYINREKLSAMDMDKFADDLNEIVQRLTKDISSETPSIIESKRTLVNILLIEGYLIYNDPRINQHCQLRFQVYLSYDVGLARRLTRTFKHVNPQPAWYFENYIWKSYHKHLDEVPNKSDLVYLNGENKVDFIFDQALKTITKFAMNHIK